MQLPPFVTRQLERVRRWDWETIAFVLCVKVLILMVAAHSVLALKESHGDWLEIWDRWDASHYLKLAEHGYTGTGPDRVSLVFYPLYPWLVRAVMFVTRNVSLAAFIVSGFAAIAAALLLKRLARFDHGEEIARATVWFLLVFPTSYFLHIAYTESLFLALTLGCFVAARSNRWAMAGALGALASLTRVNGLLLIPALAVEAFLQLYATRRINFRWLWIGAVLLGFLAYLWLNYRVTGDPFAFLQIMEKHWFKKFTPPWVGLRDVWLRIGGVNPMESSHEFFFIVMGAVFTLWCWIWSRPSYAIWMTLNWLLVISTSFVLSVPRYTLALFPIFIFLGQTCAPRRLLFAVASVVSLLHLSFYACRFVQGLWAF